MQPLDVIWQPFFPMLPTLIVAGVVAVVACALYVRSFILHPWLSSLLLPMRLLLIAGITLLLLGPSTRHAYVTHDERPTLAFMVDTSASMLTEDMDDQSRYDFVSHHWLNRDFIDQLTDNFDLQFYSFDVQSRTDNQHRLTQPAAEVATGRETNLINSVQEVLARMDHQEGGAAMLILSDGRDSREASPAGAIDLARSLNVALHTVTVGGPRLERDLHLVASPRQPYLFAEEEGAIIAQVFQTNAYETSTTLYMTHGDEQQQVPIDFGHQDVVMVDLPIQHDEPGTYEYHLRVEPLPGEVALRNNEQTVFVDVTRERLRVLMIEGEPYWDTRFIAQSLRRDSRIELTQISQINPTRQERLLTRVEDNGDLPQTLEQLSRYDVLILGRHIERVLPSALIEQLPAYVGKHGGRIIFARGRPYDTTTTQGRQIAEQLTAIEPVQWTDAVRTDQRMVLAPLGRAHPTFALTDRPDRMNQIMAELPALSRVFVTQEKTPARVLARAAPAGQGNIGDQAIPAVVTMDYHNGSVLAITGEGLWRWGLVHEQQQHLALVYDRFWSNTIRWLAMGGAFQPGEQLALRLAQRNVPAGAEVQFDVIARFVEETQINLRATLRDPQGDISEPSLRVMNSNQLRQRGSFTPETAGTYELTIDAPGLEPDRISARINVFDIDMERLQTSANPTLMRQLAERTGGMVLDPYQPEQLLEAMRLHRISMQVLPQPQFFWDRAWLMVLLLVWAGLEWLVRRKGGLL